MTGINLAEKRQPLLADYCQFLLASFENFTQTYFADHSEKWCHDQLNRLLNTERISARHPWRSVRNDIEFDADGYLLFDDTVISKPYAKEIQTVRRQWSGSEKRVIQGIGLVTCVYVNPRAAAPRATQSYCLLFVDLGLSEACRTCGRSNHLPSQRRLLDDYIRQQLSKPSTSINIA